VKSENPPEDEVLSMLHRAENLKPGDYFNVPTAQSTQSAGLVTFEISEQTQVTTGFSTIIEAEACTSKMAARL